jgi:hypothetical protein
MTYTDSFPIRFTPKAREDAVVLGPNVRMTILTSRLLRLEYSPTEAFEDRPSQVFWYCQQSVPEFDVRREDDLIEIDTNHLLLHYQPSKSGFLAGSLTISIKGHGSFSTETSLQIYVK